MKMNKNKIMNVMPTVLFITGIVGVFVSEVMAARDTLKAEAAIERHHIYKADEEHQDGIPTTKEYVKEVVKETWKCYIPTTVTTALTISAFIASKRLTAKQLAALSTTVAGVGSLLGKYRNEIKKRYGEDTLHEIDRKIASENVAKAVPPVITTSGLTTYEQMDLSEDSEYLFFDQFTNMKFRSSKLNVIGAKYYLNRNFALGGNVPLSMFYAFLGLDLPDNFKDCEWDVGEMEDSGFYWIDIDIVRSVNPDPETGEYYYILEYGIDPSDCCVDNFYPFGNPVDVEGSFAI